MNKSQPLGERAPFLSDARSEKRWFSLAGLLERAIAEPHRFGFSTPDDILPVVAEARSQHPGSLRGPIAARQFLMRCYGKFASENHISCGYHPVRILAAIHAISPARAEELIEDVLAGRLATRPLRQIYREMTEDAPPHVEGKSRSAAASKRRSLEFARVVGEFVESNLKLFCDNPEARLSASAHVDSLSPDYVIVVGDEPRVTIETMMPGPSAYRRQINAAVGLCALTLMRVEQVWIIAPPSARSHLEKMTAVAKSFGLRGAHFACFDERVAQVTPEDALTEV